MTLIADVMLASKNDDMTMEKEDTSAAHDSGLDDQSNSSSGRLDDVISIYEDAVDVSGDNTDASSAGPLTLSPSAMAEGYETARLRSLKRILDTFFDNKIHEAEALVEQQVNTCVNHSHVKMYFSAMSAMMTLDPDLMERAKNQIQTHLDFCEKRRPRRGNFASRFFRKEDYNSYTDQEMMTELNYAEALFLYAILTFFNGQTIMTLIRAAFKLNTSYNMLCFCYEVQKQKNNWSEEHCKYTFDAGVLNAIGFVNLMLSNLPSSILKLMAIAGMSGDRELGIRCLTEASQMQDQIRIQLNYCMILGYNIYLEQMLGLGEGGTDWAEQVAQTFLKQHPDGAIPLFLNARVALLRSDPQRALELYHRCLDLHSDWKQIDLFCYFDLIWSYAIVQNWEQAAKYSMVLKDNCTWGQAINMHQWAAFRYMQNEETKDPAVVTEISEAMRKVPELRVRYAGRTYPAEKFSLKRAEKYFSQGESCQLPAYELFYVWNIFSMLRRDSRLLQPIADRVDAELQSFDSTKRDMEDKCVLLLLRGVCAKYLKDYDKAIESLSQVVKMENESCLKKAYVVPHSALELGLVYKAQGDMDSAKHWIEKARGSRSSRYLLEALVQLKAHGAMRQISEGRE